MGWLFTYDATRRDIIDDLTRDQTTDQRVFRTLRKCLRGNTMYALHEGGKPGETRKFIVVYLIQRSRDGWGYKDIDEGMGPNYYDCPVKYLDEADEPMNDYARKWRAEVRKRAAERARKKPKVGEVWSLKGCKIDSVRITSLRPLRGVHEYTTYRIRRNLLGERLLAPAERQVV